jgi:hypothetical protein
MRFLLFGLSLTFQAEKQKTPAALTTGVFLGYSVSEAQVLPGPHFPTFGLGCLSGPRPHVPKACPAAYRQCSCLAPGCGVVFFVCPSCERGQVYCSVSCRKLARRLSHRAANRRHQRSEEGRLDHLDRQCAYRRRRAEARVTDHTYEPPSACATMREPSSPALNKPCSAGFPAIGPFRSPFSPDRRAVVCHFCGRRGRFLNPFHERN